MEDSSQTSGQHYLDLLERYAINGKEEFEKGLFDLLFFGRTGYKYVEEAVSLMSQEEPNDLMDHLAFADSFRVLEDNAIEVSTIKWDMDKWLEYAKQQPLQFNVGNNE